MSTVHRMNSNFTEDRHTRDKKLPKSSPVSLYFTGGYNKGQNNFCMENSNKSNIWQFRSSRLDSPPFFNHSDFIGATHPKQIYEISLSTRTTRQVQE